MERWHVVVWAEIYSRSYPSYQSLSQSLHDFDTNKYMVNEKQLIKARILYILTVTVNALILNEMINIPDSFS